MDLYEYQAKDLFAAHGVPVLPGRTVETPEEAAAAARELGGTVVVKAEVEVCWAVRHDGSPVSSGFLSG